MPLSTEFITNKPLTGTEMVSVITNDVREVLNKDGMFNSHVAYGKVAYEITIKLKMANPTYPEHVVRTASEPLKREPEDEVKELEITRAREIKSPNATRILNKLPVKVVSKQDGRVTEKELSYDGEVEVPPQPEPVDSIKEVK